MPLPFQDRVNVQTDVIVGQAYEAIGTGGLGYLGLKVQSSAPNAPANGIRLYANASGQLAIINSSGTVLIPASGSGVSTDNAIARFDGTTGSIQNSSITVSDAGVIAAASGSLSFTAPNIGAATGTSLALSGALSSGTTISAGANGEFRLSNSYSRVAQSDGSGGFIGGYNIKYSSGAKHDSIGSIAGHFASSGGYIIYTGGSAAADTAATAAFTIDNSRNGTLAGNLTVGGDRINLGVANGLNYILVPDASNTATGRISMQAGAGSSNFGGGLGLYSHSHATKPGWVVAGISSGSGGKFGVNSAGWAATGTDVFTVDESGNTVASGNITASGTGTHTFGTTNMVTMAAGVLTAAADVIVGTSAGSLFLNPRAAPGNPGTAGASAIFVDSGDNQVKIKSSNGTVNTLGGATGDMIATGDLTVSGGNVGVGGASNAAYGLNVVSTALTGTAQYGAVFNIVSTSAATDTGTMIYGRVRSAAAAFTMTTGRGLHIDAPEVGAASAITSQLGIRVENQGAAGITNAYGIDIAAQSGALTTNVGLRNAGTSLLTGAVAIGGATVSSSTACIFPASTTAISSLRIPSGAAPTSPVAGDLWYDGTNLRFRDGGTTRVITWV